MENVSNNYSLTNATFVIDGFTADPFENANDFGNEPEKVSDVVYEEKDDSAIDASLYGCNDLHAESIIKLRKNPFT